MAVVNSHKYCDGIRRRDMLSIGSMGLFGSMINLPRVMEAQARAAAEGKPAKDPQIDTQDPSKWSQELPKAT